MFRVKKIGAVALFMGLLVVLVGCGKAEQKTEYQDNNFISALESGLAARWQLTDKDDSEATKADYTKWINVELAEVTSFRNKKFKSAKLQEAAIAYISSLNEQKAALKYFSADEFIEKWSDAYDKRTKALVTINKLHKLKVAKSEQHNLDELLGNGKAVNEKTDKDQQVDALLKTINFTAQPKDYAEDTYTTYTTEVTNTTGFDIKAFTANIKIKDAAGTTVDTQYISTQNWSQNDKVKFDFMTDQQVASYEVIKDMVEY
ncbi:MAG: FxLYD domain-containing protein [Loigolactobacillus coryniformis]|uniref:FxLYD domain-containing protein n=1 Tax=Loigolactobacillus coryniformis TaxID=1610 RepID=UPI002646FD79|nr:FxLYD domain-containing protein [Loigolactobacillus coryniformis]MDN5953049.1 FxLYD domain-containing protein [Loigolactobacillus coryniformis]